MAEMYDVPPPEAPETDDYRIEARRWNFSGMLLVSVSYPGMQMVRHGRHIQKDQFDHYIVGVRRSGLLNVDAEGARRTMNRRG